MGARKAVDDVLGGEEAWQNVDQTEAVCAKCNHTRAYFTQHQLRSADEPMTIFYKCVKCGNRWREG
jgi:DNA-directed RNA polymerase III subunit RPC11